MHHTPVQENRKTFMKVPVRNLVYAVHTTEFRGFGKLFLP